MTSKTFSGQYQDEQILLVVQSTIIATLFENIQKILWLLGVAGTISLIIALEYGNTLALGILIIAVVSCVFIVKNISHHPKGYITNRRIIQFTHEGFMKTGRREVKLGSIQQISSKNDGVLGKIYNYGTLIINRSGDTVQFSGIPYFDELDTYISKIIDYQANNGSMDTLTPFIPRKIREQQKTTPLFQE